MITNFFYHKPAIMKKATISNAYKFILTFIFSCIQFLSFSQDSTGSSTTVTKTSTTTTTSEWYTQPWVWVVGGAVLIIILVALFRGNSSKEVTRTTIIKDDRL